MLKRIGIATATGLISGPVGFVWVRFLIYMGVPFDQIAAMMADYTNLAVSSNQVFWGGVALFATMVWGLSLAVLHWLSNWRTTDASSESAAKPSENVRLTPSSGQRSDVRLSVKNEGQAGLFSAQCQILAARNEPNQLKRGAFNLGWYSHNDRSISIEAGETQELLIADWRRWPTDDLCSMRLLEWGESGPQEYWGARWNMPTPRALLPAYDLELTLIKQGTAKPETNRYTVRPVKYSGPLEMAALGEAFSERHIIAVELVDEPPYIGQRPVVCAIRITNTGDALDERCLVQIEHHGLRRPVPDPIVIKTEEQLREERVGRFTLSAGQTKLIPIIFRVQAAFGRYYFIEDNGEQYEFMPPIDFDLVILGAERATRVHIGFSLEDNRYPVSTMEYR